MNSKKLIRYIVIAVGVLILSLLAVNIANSQTFGVETDMKLWASPDRCYQNSMSVGVEAKVPLYKILYTEGFMRAKWWGACDAKVPASPLNAEAGKVIERKHGVNLGIQIPSGFQFGTTLRRRAVHHIWRHKDRHNHFPGSWQIGRQGCTGGDAPSWPDDKPQCPSIGYWDGLRGFIGFENDRWDVIAMSPQYSWKSSLTLPYPDYILDAEYNRDKWGGELHLQGGEIVEFTYDVELKRRVFKELWISSGYGYINAPGWKSPLRRFYARVSMNL